MRIEKLVDQSEDVVPVIAALPFAIFLSRDEALEDGNYDPNIQLTSYNYANGYTTCRIDDSAGHIFTTKSDHGKDDSN